MTTDKTKAQTLSKNSDAVPTQLGWVNRKTGELLVSIRGLSNPYKWDRPTNTFTRNGQPAEFGGPGFVADRQEVATPASQTEAARIETPAPSAVKSADKVEEPKIVDPEIVEKAKEETKPEKVKKTPTKRTTKKAAKEG